MGYSNTTQELPVPRVHALVQVVRVTGVRHARPTDGKSARPTMRHAGPPASRPGVLLFNVLLLLLAVLDDVLEHGLRREVLSSLLRPGTVSRWEAYCLKRFAARKRNL